MAKRFPDDDDLPAMEFLALEPSTSRGPPRRCFQDSLRGGNPSTRPGWEMVEVPYVKNEVHFLYRPKPSKVPDYISQMKYWRTLIPNAPETAMTHHFLEQALAYLNELKVTGVSVMHPNGLAPPRMPKFALRLTQRELEPQNEQGRAPRPRAPPPMLATDEEGNVLMNDQGKPKVKCETCDKVLADASSLYRHRRIHTNQRDHRCYICSKNFLQRFNMKAHTCTHQADWIPAEILVSMASDIQDMYLGNEENNDPDEMTKRVARKRKAIHVQKVQARKNAKLAQAKAAAALPRPLLLPPNQPFQLNPSSFVGRAPGQPAIGPFFGHRMGQPPPAAGPMAQVSVMARLSLLSRAQQIAQAEREAQARRDADMPLMQLANIAGMIQAMRKNQPPPKK